MKNSFEEQYPDYPVVPEKKAMKRFYFALAWAAFAVFCIGLPLLMFKALSYTVPTPNQASVGQTALLTLRAVALDQSEAENHVEAVKSFERYFALGGKEADIMALYAYSLLEIGRKDEARAWSGRAIASDPKSKAAQLIEKELKR